MKHGNLNRRPSRDSKKRTVTKFSRRGFIKSSAGIIAAPLLMHCGSFLETEEPEIPGNPKLTAKPGTPMETPEFGLSQLGLANGRDGLLYVPESHSPDSAAPLFIGLHGAGGSAGNWESYYARAEKRGFVFLAPDSRASTWDVIRGSFGPDVEFIDRALKHTFARCRIDPGKIALGGFSDGASYALSLGLSNGDIFSHIVAYSPGFFRAPAPEGMPRIYISHGTQDNILPVSASREKIVPSLKDDSYDVFYHEFEGGHEVPASISDSALDWFFAAD